MSGRGNARALPLPSNMVTWRLNPRLNIVMRHKIFINIQTIFNEIEFTNEFLFFNDAVVASSKTATQNTYLHIQVTVRRTRKVNTYREFPLSDAVPVPIKPALQGLHGFPNVPNARTLVTAYQVDDV